MCAGSWRCPARLGRSPRSEGCVLGCRTPNCGFLTFPRGVQRAGRTACGCRTLVRSGILLAEGIPEFLESEPSVSQGKHTLNRGQGRVSGFSAEFLRLEPGPADPKPGRRDVPRSALQLTGPFTILSEEDARGFKFFPGQKRTDIRRGHLSRHDFDSALIYT